MFLLATTKKRTFSCFWDHLFLNGEISDVNFPRSWVPSSLIFADKDPILLHQIWNFFENAPNFLRFECFRNSHEGNRSSGLNILNKFTPSHATSAPNFAGYRRNCFFDLTAFFLIVFPVLNRWPEIFPGLSPLFINAIHKTSSKSINKLLHWFYSFWHGLLVYRSDPATIFRSLSPRNEKF